MIAIRRSAVKRPRSAFRMREKPAAAIPVWAYTLRTLMPSRSSALMISAARIALNCSTPAFFFSRSRQTFPLPRTTSTGFFFHRNISFSLFSRSFIKSSRNRFAARPDTADLARAENVFSRSCAGVIALIDDVSTVDYLTTVIFLFSRWKRSCTSSFLLKKLIMPTTSITARYPEMKNCNCCST